MAYWAVARLQPQRERLALHCLGLAGYEVYLPRLRERQVVRGRRIDVTPPLFPGYAFVSIELQWSSARYAWGVAGLIMNGIGPAKVPDTMIAEIKGRERNGAIELAKPPQLRRGDSIRVVGGLFKGQLAIFVGMSGHQRVEVLLTWLGAAQRVTLPKGDVEAMG